MGDIIPFRDKRRWTRSEDYGNDSGSPGKGPGRPPQKPRRSKWRWPKAWFFWLVASIGIGLWVAEDPALMEPPAALATEPEKVDADFTRCGKERGANCVIDGDTIKLGARKIRVIGIDAPETSKPGCAAEAEMGEKATAHLQRLLNQGPFVMVGRIDQPTDKYGRELRALKRSSEQGEVQLIASEMIASGTVRAYRGDFRKSWCTSLAGDQLK